MSQQNNQAGSPDPRRGILGRVTGVVYWLVVIELCFLLASLPGFAGFLFLQPVAGNIPLFALCLLPVGPALSAAFTALRARQRDRDVDDPWRRFWRAWVGNLREVLVLWVPALAVLTLLGFNAAFAGAVGVPFQIIAIVLGVVLLVWTVHVLTIVSLFAFRTRDAARLALFYIFAKPLVSLGVLSFLVLTVALVFLVSAWAPALLASVVAMLLLANARPMVADIEARFTQ